MPSEHSRSSSASSVTSPIPTINVKLVNPTKPNGSSLLETPLSSSVRGSHSDLLEIFNARISANAREQRDRNSDKRGKSPSGRPKSPSISDKFLDRPKGQDRSRSRSPGPKSPKNSGSNNNSMNNRDSSRSKSPRPNHNRDGGDNLSRSSSQDARLSLGSSVLHPWIAPSLGNGNNNGSNDRSLKSSNRLSLPPNFADFNINTIRENNERWARLNLTQTTISEKDSKNIMGNFSKTTLKGTTILRPKLSVETFNSFGGSKPLQRTPSGRSSGSANNSSPLLVPGGLPLMRSRSHNSAMDDVHRLSPKFLKELDKQHPLQHSWTMYYDSKPVMTPGPKTPTLKNSYEENLQKIGTFNTVETFCRYFNWVKKPSQLELNTNFHIFKNKIKPMWEDPANANGGKWVISMRNPQLLDRCWTWLVYSLVGEELDENDDICGAVMSRRSRGDRIAVWVRDKDNVSVINGIGRRLLKILDLQNEKGIGMDFQFNEDALKSGTSYNNRVYLSLESLKQELENEEKTKREAEEKAKLKGSSTTSVTTTEKIEESETTEYTRSAPDIITEDVDAEEVRNNIDDDADSTEKSSS
ncbi:5160_t:CDS:2 [Ambispora leptoticha]|uniref:5160_t:CDS:1 n=1 Tax=Ambispora leptoticha TaxID=144679 RepID=A0A9N8ZBA7_9GLOM|nr:5160_t:CDS:2 [Ambispora leptoticha]